jgi:microcompartment protein CcmK/EutM
MILARVLGNVVATQKNSRYGNPRIMLVQPITPDGAPRGAPSGLIG